MAGHKTVHSYQYLSTMLQMLKTFCHGKPVFKKPNGNPGNTAVAEWDLERANALQPAPGY
jgi:hypothetical protein